MTRPLGRITVRNAERTGFLVTNGKVAPEMVSEGNAMTLLIDGKEAFGSAAATMEAATSTLNMTQLFFGDTGLRAGRPPTSTRSWCSRSEPPSHRPARPAARRARSRHRSRARRTSGPSAWSSTRRAARWRCGSSSTSPGVSWPEGIFWLAVLTPAAVGVGVGAVGWWPLAMGAGFALLPVIVGLTLVAYLVEAIVVPWKLGKVSDVKELRAYLDNGLVRIPPPRGDITVRPFPQPAPDNGVLHTKMVIADGQRATVLGSPYSQRYFDDQLHHIDNPERGDTTSDIVHDVSVGLIGPVVRDLYETFRLYWNEDQTPGDQIPALKPERRSPKAQTEGTDGVVKAQVVRTLSAGRFSSLDGTSEKGILESYLRAFGAATKLIYLENQYFTDAIIADALARALKENTNLELVFLLNIKPDVMFYPGRQARLVKQVRDAAPDRVGVFTRWSYDHTRPRPWVAPIYLHSKTGVVDDGWATIGSANLDGLSLDHNLLLSPLTFGETTAAELNVTMVEGTPGASGMAPAERLRRRLWAEHLGILGQRRAAQPGGRPARGHEPEEVGADLEAVGQGLARPSEERDGCPAPGLRPRVPGRGRWLPRHPPQAPDRPRCPARPRRAEGPPDRRHPGLRLLQRALEAVHPRGLRRCGSARGVMTGHER